MEDTIECVTTPTEHENRKKNLCGCTNQRWGLVAAGAAELTLGTVGLCLIRLGPQKRHTILNPLEDIHTTEVYSEQWEDTIQLLIEFWLPSLAYWILGVVLLIAAIARRMSFLVCWIFISTLLLAGSIAGILALLVAGANVIGLLPVILATVMQMYFYVSISDITYSHWRIGNPKQDDKEILVDSTV